MLGVAAGSTPESKTSSRVRPSTVHNRAPARAIGVEIRPRRGDRVPHSVAGEDVRRRARVRVDDSLVGVGRMRRSRRPRAAPGRVRGARSPPRRPAAPAPPSPAGSPVGLTSRSPIAGIDSRSATVRIVAGSAVELAEPPSPQRRERRYRVADLRSDQPVLQARERTLGCAGTRPLPRTKNYRARARSSPCAPRSARSPAGRHRTNRPRHRSRRARRSAPRRPC